MTVAEMHNEFRIRFDNIASFSNPEYTPEEIDFFLNSGQEELLIVIKADGIERNQTYRDFLANITTNFDSTAFVTNSSNHVNGVFVALPTDYRTALEEAAEVTYNDCNGTSTTNRIPIIPTTHDRLGEEVRNPFKKPKSDGRVLSLPFSRLAGTPTQQTVELIGSTDFTISKYFLRYFRDPLTIQYGTQYAIVGLNIDCELNNEAQDWIIEKSVQIALDSTAQLQRYQMSKQTELINKQDDLNN